MALKLGVDSVMCDGSALPYEENVAWTAKMAAKAHALVRWFVRLGGWIGVVLVCLLCALGPPLPSGPTHTHK